MLQAGVFLSFFFYVTVQQTVAEGVDNGDKSSIKTGDETVKKKKKKKRKLEESKEVPAKKIKADSISEEDDSEENQQDADSAESESNLEESESNKTVESIMCKIITDSVNVV